MMRRSTPVFAVLGAGALGLGLAGLHAALSAPTEARRIAETARLVRAVGLTDLALFTEARYVRHPAMADLHSAFQDNPMAFEHFPTGSFVPPPTHFGAATLGTDEHEVRR